MAWLSRILSVGKVLLGVAHRAHHVLEEPHNQEAELTKEEIEALREWIKLLREMQAEDNL